MKFTKKRILTSKDLKFLRGSDGNTFKKRLSYNLKTDKLAKLRKWIYLVQDKTTPLTIDDYLSLANSIYTPSYISFETVTRKHGATFQRYSGIFIACAYSKELKISIEDDIISIYCVRLPQEIISCPIGIEEHNGYAMASLERAICDILRRYPNYYFDHINPKNINKEELKQILAVYELYKPWFSQNVLSTLQSYDDHTTLSA